MPTPTAKSKKTRLRTVTIGTLLFGGLCLLVVACEASRPAVSDGVTSGDGITLTVPCTREGATSACHVETGRVGSVVNCFSGTQTCVGGVWGPCGGGSGTLSTFDLSLVGMSAHGETISPLTVTATYPFTAYAASCAGAELVTT